MSTPRKIVNLLVAPLVLVLAVFIAGKLIASKEAPQPRPPQVAIARVQTLSVSPETIRPTIHTYGNTRSYLTTTLSPQVSGEILSIAPGFEVGMTVSKGAPLVTIDDADYQAILTERQSTLATARQTLEEEQTLSRLAEEDWQASGRKLSDAADYTLRKPQLTAAKAAVAAAEASVEKASLDVSRTQITAPFDAIVESRSASPGNVVSTGSSLGTLIARQRIEARLPLTPEQVTQFGLARVESSPPVAQLTTSTLPGVSWTANITRIEPAVDVKSQTLWVIAEISDPFAKPEALLPVGTFVNATIDGEALEDVVRFPEVAVVEDQYVWAVGTDKTLARQPVEIVYSNDGEILARIPAPLADFPIDVVARPLASFKAGQTVQPIVPVKP